MLFKIPVDTPIQELIREYTFCTLEICNGNRVKTAERLGITVRTLRNWLIKWQTEGFQLPKYSTKHHNERFHYHNQDTSVKPKQSSFLPSQLV